MESQAPWPGLLGAGHPLNPENNSIRFQPDPTCGSSNCRRGRLGRFLEETAAEKGRKSAIAVWQARLSFATVYVSARSFLAFAKTVESRALMITMRAPFSNRKLEIFAGSLDLRVAASCQLATTIAQPNTGNLRGRF
jgi:hypothetical protein